MTAVLSFILIQACRAEDVKPEPEDWPLLSRAGQSAKIEALRHGARCALQSEIARGTAGNDPADLLVTRLGMDSNTAQAIVTLAKQEDCAPTPIS